MIWRLINLKKIKVNKDDVSFVNKFDFGKLYDRIVKVVVRGGLVISVVGLLYSLSWKIIDEKIEAPRKTYQEVVDLNTYNTTLNNDYNFSYIFQDSYLSFPDSFPTTILPNARFTDQGLVGIDNQLIILTDSEKKIYFLDVNPSFESLENADLRNSKTKSISFKYSHIFDDVMFCLPETLTYLNISYCNFISDLRILPSACPNLESLYIDCMPALTNLSFIYSLNNLKELYIQDSPYVTEDLLSYLNSKNIKTNLNENQVNNARALDVIVSSIITEDMTDMEKIGAISTYVVNNLDYEVELSIESNRSPLTTYFNTGGGVCFSYSYLTTALLNKVNVNAKSFSGQSHTVNLIESQGEYYDLDLTLIDNSEAQADYYNYMIENTSQMKDFMLEIILNSKQFEEFKSIANLPQDIITDIKNKLTQEELSEKKGIEIRRFLAEKGAPIFFAIMSAYFSHLLIEERKSLRKELEHKASL